MTSRWRLLATGIALVLAVIAGLTFAFAVTITDFVENPSWETLFVAAVPGLMFGLPGGTLAAIIIVGSRFSPPRANEKEHPPE